MPENLSNTAAENQTVALPLSREPSTIPRADGTLWQYPSPQQMYNALLRKGYTDTPAAHVTSMVSVHNFLNEGAWAEILEWERRFSSGLVEGWRRCQRGEDGSVAGAMIEADATAAGWDGAEPPRLVRFMGRPGDLTPKAQVQQWLAWAWPSQYKGELPFDRHDWFVRRVVPGAKGSGSGGEEGKEVRYVIDYYEGPPEPTGEPVFYLDVRPAVDGPTAACERLLRWGGDVWWRASGGVVREAKEREKLYKQRFAEQRS